MDITSYLAIKKVKLHGKLSLPPNRKKYYFTFLTFSSGSYSPELCHCFCILKNLVLFKVYVIHLISFLNQDP